MGRLRVRWEEKSKISLLKAIQGKLQEKGYNVDFGKIDEFQLRGGAGVDIVRSTVAGIVQEAMLETQQTMKKYDCSFRTAAIINGLERIKEKIKDSGKY